MSINFAAQRPARGRQRHAARGSLEQADAQCFLQRLDLTAQRRLAQVKRFGGACQLANFRDRHKSA
jgi:hypothetical protein